MPVDYNRNNLFYRKGLNVTPISSVDSFNSQDDCSFNVSGRSSFNSFQNALEADSDVQTWKSNNSVNTNSGKYDSTSGYGLINAAAAVSKAAGKKTFGDVAVKGGNDWGADLVKAPEAWAKGYTGKGVVVAVIDTGVDRNHEDLKDNIWINTNEIADNGIDDDGNGYIDDAQGWNFADNTNNTLDDNGHGTHVSGTIAGENNGIGVTGVAYDAKIMPVKVLNASGSGSYDAIANGIYYAVNNGANVINLSLGGDFPNDTLESAIKYASNKGVTVCMAAGNDSSFQPGYPAHYADKYGIAVGAVDQNQDMAYFSNRSGFQPLTYVTAPGVGVYSTLPGNKYASYNGTSMATPHVAGVVALMLSANRGLTNAQVRAIIAQTSGNSTQSTNSSLNIGSTSNSNITNFSFDYNSMTENQTATFNFSPSSVIESKNATSDLSYRPTNENSHMFANLDMRSYFVNYYNDSSSNSIRSDDTNVESLLKKRKTPLEEYQERLVNLGSRTV
jgi:subtilisin